MIFAKEQLEIKDRLEKLGHDVLVTDDIGNYVDRPTVKQDFTEELRLSREYDIMRTFFNKIEKSDALLICNFPRDGVAGYLGVSALMEIGLAYYLRKKIYLLFEIDGARGYALEVAIINPTIINGDVSRII